MNANDFTLGLVLGIILTTFLFGMGAVVLAVVLA